MALPIDPETKVGALLEAYPGIEETLIALAPAFQKLRNPILRKTVAKVASLEQAARVGGVGVREMVSALRAAAGVDGAEVEARGNGGEGAPAWLSGAVVQEIDGDRMLETGVHPIGKVRESVERLAPGEAVRLTTSFRPEPLIDLIRRNGAEVFSREAAPGRHETYFRK